MTQTVVKKRTLRRQQKNQLIKEAQQDIDTIENRIEKLPNNARTERAALTILLDILYIHAQELINSEV